VTVEKARDAARIRLGRLAAGFDPKAEREAKRAADARRREEAAAAKLEAAFTLETLIEDWSRLHLSSRRPRYAAEAVRALRQAFSKHLARPAARLTHEEVQGVLDRITAAGKATTAGLTLAYGRSCYGWALKRRRLHLNPFAGLPAIDGGSEARDRVLSSDEVGEVWRAAGGLAAPHGPMVRFLLLTLARRDEAAGITWGEIAPDLSAWTQPGARTKNGRPHVVHLSAPARAVLRQLLGAGGEKSRPSMPPADRLVFGLAENRPVTAHSWVKREVDKAIVAERVERAEKARKKPQALEPWRLHDFRRTGVTWLAGAGFAPHVADRLLNHVSGTISGVAAIYQKSEFLHERRAALDAWAEHVIAAGEEREQANIIEDLAAARRRRRKEA